jgi:hypothetical protein
MTKMAGLIEEGWKSESESTNFDEKMRRKMSEV